MIPLFHEERMPTLKFLGLALAEILDVIATLDGEAAEVLGGIRKAVGKFKR